MGRALMKFPVFTRAIHKCDTVLRPHSIFVTDILINEDTHIVDNVVNLFVGLTGLQIGTVDLLTSIGITPDIIMGDSIGELICGYADGYLTAEETITLAYYAGLTFLKSKITHGLMAEINVDFKTLKNMCSLDIDIACYNNSHNSINDNISVKEISCGHIPFHSRYVEPARIKLLEYLTQILPRKTSSSSKWKLNVLNKSYNWFNASSDSCLAKYYTNHLLAPVLFSESVCVIPNDAVTIEIVPHDILQYILNNSLETTITNVGLYQCFYKPNIEIFLHGSGKLYNAGLQTQIANLCPKVKFPVSRGTPMISHLVRWNYSEDWYTYHYSGQRKLTKG
ncbi:fatty acid synthase-like [Anoplolepis gracilipes]|uniref:fatty acid synthase-like n=1 Tax=Anoplolepis gracilipes TaxID=354296 RepID=UPI003BA16AF8